MEITAFATIPDVHMLQGGFSPAASLAALTTLGEGGSYGSAICLPAARAVLAFEKRSAHG